MSFAEVSCHNCAVLPAGKFVMASVTLSARRQLFVDDHHRHCVVRRAHSGERREQLSGSGPVSSTLVSPKADFAPS